MTIFLYDKTFEGLLCCIFDAYSYKLFPNIMLKNGSPLPLFYDNIHEVVNNSENAKRVWAALDRKLSKSALSCITSCWFADGHKGIDELLFRFMRKNIDSPKSIELNFSDKDVLEIKNVYKQIRYERLRIMQFIRFQKAADNIYFAAFSPDHNVLPLAISHFEDRFADQKWLIYDIKREYGYFYDLQEVREVRFTEKSNPLITGFLDEKNMAEDEKVFQNLWKTYYKSISIKERSNPRKHRQDMPARYWKYLTEKR